MHKRNGVRAALRGKRVAVAVAAAFVPLGEAYSLPTGENVVHGTVQVTRPTAEMMQINQATQKGIVNWQGFSIGSTEHVNITQPNSSASLLNRVVGNDPSSIFGRLTANGQVFLVNNAGVFFAPGASVEVGALVASTLSITDQSFINGIYQFQNSGNAGSVVNQGSIITAGGFTALIGPQVRNDGVIIANSGKIALGAGDRVSLDVVGDGLISISVDQAAFNASVINTGTLQADGGTVFLKASSTNALLDTVINTSGIVRASSLGIVNGEIVLDAGPNGGISVAGLVDATNMDPSSGGAVSITGGRLHVQNLTPAPLEGVTGGTVSVNVIADVTVEGGQIASRAGQTITAGSLVVRAQSGELARVHNESGNQAITATGADGIRVEALNGGSAIIGKPFFIGGPPATDSQTISTTRLQMQGGSIQAGEQNITASAGVLVEGGAISTQGAQNIVVGGHLSLRSGSIGTLGGGNQTIAVSGGNLDVSALTPGQITTIQANGAQSISVTGGSIDVRGAAPGGGAFISTGGAQSISVTNGDHLNVNGVAGNAGINTNGSQIISLTGSGNNALTLGSDGAQGLSQIFGGGQTITAGRSALGELGSIEIIGSNGPASFVGIGTNFAPGVPGTQNVSTSGALTIRGGNSPFQPPAGPPPALAFSATGIAQNASGTQTIQAGALVLQGGSGINNNAFISSNQGGSQSVSSGSITLIGGASGQNNSAIITSSTGGNQSVTVSGGAITVTGGPGGLANRAGIVTNANQTISGNPDIVLTGGAGGGAGNNSNNVFIQATGPDTTQQTINARSIRLASGAGTDASATFNAARQVINATGDVSIFGGAGPGASNGARIGGIGGNVLGPTNLTLNAGNVLLSGGMLNGASFGSSGASTQANTITVNAAGDIKLESQGAGARIGSSNQAGATPGTISVTAGGSLELGNGTAVRTSGPITLTANSLTNEGAITNGGGANTNNIVLNANAFDLAGGNIQGGAAAVVLRPRTGTNFFGIEAAGDTTLTNADIASINTSNFIVFGSGIGTTFTGNLFIGENAAVDGGAKNLAFFRGTALGTTTIGSQGVITSGDVIVASGLGSLVSNGGTVRGDEVQLRAAQGIGGPGARVNTAANALAINNSTAGGSFVSEQDDVTLRTVSFNVGGNVNTFSNFNAGTLDLQVGGALSVDARGTLDAVVSSVGGQTISAQSVSVTARDGRTAQLLNSAFGNQQITAGTIDIETSTGGGLAEIRNNSAGSQTLMVLGDHLSIKGLGGGTAGVFGAGNQTIHMSSLGPKQITLGDHAALGRALIASNGDQTINGNADLTLIGGSGPIADGSNALFLVSNPGRLQTVNAGTVTLANSMFGGNNSVAGIQGANQVITTTGDVTMTAHASGGILPGVRIGGLGGVAGTATNLTLNVGRDLILTGGNFAGNGVGIGATGTANTAFASNITINAPNGSVILNSGVAGSGVRIGSAATTATAPGNITINAGGDIRLNGVDATAAIRTLDTVTLNAANISEAVLGTIIAGTLNTNTSGSALLTGTNAVSNFSAIAGTDVALNNTGPLNVTGLFAGGNATLINSGNVTLSGPWNSFGASSISIASDLNVNSFVQSNGPMTLDVDGAVRVVGSGVQDASLSSFGGQTINARSLEVTSLDGRFASVGNNGSGDQTITVSGGGIDIDSISGNGFAFITNSGSGGQLISVTDGAGIQVRTSSGSGSGQINNFGTGNQTINVSGGGGVDVRTLSGTGFAVISNAGTGSQTVSVTGGSGVDVASAGGFANISNSAQGSQSIIVTGGEGIDVLSTGGSAGIGQNAAGLAQTIAVTDADHISLDGMLGSAFISANGGAQTVSITGSSSNAIRLGSSGALGFSQIASGSTQNVTAGLAGEQGSITIVGPAANSTAASIVSRPGPGGTQTIATSGTISITGGSAPAQLGNFPAGIFHNGTGQQTINAASLVLTGGPSGNNNAALINVPGGGVLANAAAQMINVSGDITIAGGPGGNAGIVGSASRLQTIFADNISLTNSALGGNNIAGFINGGHQAIHATGNVTLTARASGGDLPGVRIGGLAANPAAGLLAPGTDLQLFVGRELVLNGGTVINNGVGIGTTGAAGLPPLTNDITINAGGSVILNSGTLAGTGARIGNSGATPTGPGSINITAGGGIELNGVSQGTAIRTLGTVTLAADHITEATNGFIIAGTLNTTTQGHQILTGPNQVASFTASSETGNVSLRNTALVLTLGSMELPGALLIDQTGTLSIPGTVSALSHAIDATGDVFVGSAGATNAALLYASGDISIGTPGSVIVRGSDVTPLAASAVLAGGNLQVAAGNITIQGGGALLTPAAMRGEAVDINAASELRVKGGSGHLSPAVLSSGSNIDLTIGDAVRVDAGSGLLSVARIQTEIKNGVIHISFPNLEEGGYFVNGIEGKTHHGQTGFFTLNKPAKVGKTLLLEYGD